MMTSTILAGSAEMAGRLVTGDCAIRDDELLRCVVNAAAEPTETAALRTTSSFAGFIVGNGGIDESRSCGV